MPKDRVKKEKDRTEKETEYSDDEGTDRVVTEIPVYLNKALSDELCVFKYPYQTTIHGNTSKTVTGARIKPKSGVIEMDCLLDTSSEFYNSDMGEYLATPNDAAYEDVKVNPVQTPKLNKLKIRGESCVDEDETNTYLVGVMNEGKFYLNPIHNYYRFQPAHVSHDELDLVEKKKKKNSSDKLANEENNDDNEDDIVPVTVKFAQKKAMINKSKKAMNEAKFLEHYKERADEPWVELKYCDDNTISSMKEADKLTNTTKRNRINSLALTEADYKKILLPNSNTEEKLYGMFFEKLGDKPKRIAVPVHTETDIASDT